MIALRLIPPRRLGRAMIGVDRHRAVTVTAASRDDSIEFAKYDGVGNGVILVDDRDRSDQSLTPEERNFCAPAGLFFALNCFMVLTIDAPAPAIPGRRGTTPASARLDGEPVRRSIPGSIQTAHRGRSKVFEDPTGGLGSIEALYLARKLLGDDDPGLLEGYHWKDEFWRRCGHKHEILVDVPGAPSPSR